MHKEILTDAQRELLPLVGKFSEEFGLVGGTAIALHLGHRRSVDFDLFSVREIDAFDVERKTTGNFKVEKTLVNKTGEYTILVNGVKMTFFHYPFKISFVTNFEDVIKLPDLLTLAAMKAFALGRRAKWKDYVDLYFITKHHRLKAITQKAQALFQKEFNEKLFRAQLAYFDDVDYSETITYLPGFEVDNEIIKASLTEASLS